MTITPLRSEVMRCVRYDYAIQCQRCGQQLASDQPVVVIERWLPTDGWSARRLLGTTDVDLHCAMDHDPTLLAAALCVLQRSESLRDQERAVQQLLEHRLQLIHRRAQQRPQYRKPTTKELWRGPVGAARPEVHASTTLDEPPLEMAARDHSGRPPLKILCCGMATNSRTQTGNAFWTTLHASTWSSPKREYQFVHVTDPWQLPEEDPAHPIVGTLYAAVASKRATVEGLRGLALWGALRLPSPVVWLLGLSSTKPRDAQTLQFRELLQSCAFNPDQSMVLCSLKPTASTFDLLVAMLDEQFATGEEIR